MILLTLTRLFVIEESHNRNLRRSSENVKSVINYSWIARFRLQRFVFVDRKISTAMFCIYTSQDFDCNFVENIFEVLGPHTLQRVRF